MAATLIIIVTTIPISSIAMLVTMRTAMTTNDNDNDNDSGRVGIKRTTDKDKQESRRKHTYKETNQNEL